MVLETVRGLRQAGRTVVVVLPGPGPLVELVEATGATVRQSPLPVLRKSSLSPRGLLSLLAGVARSVGPARALICDVQPESVYVSTLTVPSWLLIARLSGRRTVCHVHEAERRGRVIGLALTLPLLCAHRLILNSAYSASVLTDSLPWLRGRIDVVLNGVVGPDQPIPPREHVTGALRVLYIGRLSPRKGPDVAADAVREARRRGVDAHLEVMGSVFPGYEWFEQRLREDNADLLAAGSLTLTGFSPSIWGQFAAADVVVVPSTLPEPFGNTAVEAMLAGRPVVVSSTGGLPEAVAGCPSALTVPPSDPDSLAAALVRVSVDWPELAHRAYAHRVAAAARYAPSRYGREVVAIVGAEPVTRGLVRRRRSATAGP